MASLRQDSVVPFQVMDAWLSGFGPGFNLEGKTNLGY